MRKKNYLNNKDLLLEIHKSKLSYCSLLDTDYNMYDHIVLSYDELNKKALAEAKIGKAARLSAEAYERAMAEFSGTASNKPKKAQFKVDPNSLKDDEVVVRLMTFEHIPPDPTRRKNPRREAEKYVKLNFPPFKHFVFIGGEWKEVLRSHWIGGFGNGSFSCTHGKMTEKLAKMIIMMCEKYSMKGNWRGYSFLEDMKSAAILQLTDAGLKFNEKFTLNPFAYYTTTINRAFISVLNSEKKNHEIRDDILQDNGYMPSINRQIENELEQKGYN